MSDIIDRIDELIDEQLAAGEPMTGYDYGDPQYPKCPHCGRHWHGLPITAAIARMYWLGQYEPAYIHADDTSPVLCDGSDFIGPVRAHGLTDAERLRRAMETAEPRPEIYFHIVVDHRRSWRLQRYREYMEQLRSILVWPQWQIPDISLDVGQWFIGPRGHHQTGGIIYDEWHQSINPVERPLPEIDWTPGPHNWGYELRTREEHPPQLPRGWRWLESPPNPLQPLIDQHWHEFTAPENPLPEPPGFDFSAYVTSDHEYVDLILDRRGRR